MSKKTEVRFGLLSRLRCFFMGHWMVAYDLNRDRCISCGKFRFCKGSYWYLGGDK